MVWCQVIKANNKPCANYARKGLTCCYAHRKLENTEVVAPNPCDPKYSPAEPAESVKPVKLEAKVLEVFEITPWDDDGAWNDIIEAAYISAEEFVWGLAWLACCSLATYKGPAQFVFHKSLADKHAKHIMLIGVKTKVYKSWINTDKCLVVQTVIN